MRGHAQHQEQIKSLAIGSHWAVLMATHVIAISPGHTREGKQSI